MFANERHFTQDEVAAFHPDVAHFLNVGEDGRIGTGEGSQEVKDMAAELAVVAKVGRDAGWSNAQIGNNLARIAGDYGLDVPDVYYGLTDEEKRKILGVVYLAGVACLALTAGGATVLWLVK